MMEPTLELFRNSELGDIRVVTRENGYWFVARDVAACIGYSDASKMCELCRDGDKYTVTKLEASGVEESNKHVKSLILVSEPGLYRIFAKSNKPKCEPFEKWVFEDVLPSIRKRGVYAKPSAGESMTPEELMAKAVLAAQDTIARLQRERDEAVRTRARISAGREATLMATCRNQKDRIANLENENRDLREQIGGRKAEERMILRDVKWINEIFTYMPVNGEFGIGVTNRMSTCMRTLAGEMGKHILPSDAILDKGTGRTIQTWPVSVIDEMKRHLDTMDRNDKYVKFMLAYFKPSLKRKILEEKKE